MTRFRLRYRHNDLELPVGDFVIGRSSRCNLGLADALISRKHAVLRVSPDSVVVEDLESRNGVIVNGLAIEAPRKLSHLDRVFIGSQELILIDAEQITEPMANQRFVVCSGCGAVSGAAKRHCGDCGRRLDPATGATSKDWSGVSSSRWSDVTRPVEKLELIAGIASKAMKLGRLDEAERVLLPHLDELLERAMRGRPLVESNEEDADGLFDRAAGLALSLVPGPRGIGWIDWVFRFHTATDRIMTSETVDALHELVRVYHYREPRYVHAYLHVVRTQAAKLTSAEKFLVRRVEGLAKVIEAHSRAVRA